MMNRDIRIDFLRSLAIILIILAHVSPTPGVFQIRMFDVPLMTMLLGMSFVLSSYKTKKDTYINFILKRFQRLVIPAWVFLTLFFLIYFVISLVLRRNIPFSLGIILTSYSLISGIGYVWIIRVFFTVAVFSPFLLIVSKKITNFYLKVLTLLSLLMVQQQLCVLNSKMSDKLELLFEQVVAVSFGYIIIALIGIWVVNQTKKENLIMGISFFTLFIIIGYKEGYPLLSTQKYPPTIYYLSYGIGISLILLYLISNETIISLLNKKSVIWVSRHSLELYYWHVFPVTYIAIEFPNISWVSKFIVTLIITISATLFQIKYIPGFFYMDYRK